MYAAAILSLSLLLVVPKLGASLALEDGPVEYLSALLLLVSSFIMAINGIRIFTRQPSATRTPLYLFIIAAIFFVMAGEEVSWGQRIFEISSNDFFLEYNWQGEMNVHNLHTDIANLLFHYGALVFLILLPVSIKYLGRVFPSWLTREIDPFISPLWLVAPSLVFVGMIDPRFVYVIEKPWASILYLLALFLGLIVLYWQARHSIKRKNKPGLVALSLSLAVISLGLLVSFFEADGASPNSISEYKELIITLGLFFFAVNWKPAQTRQTQPKRKKLKHA